MQVLPWHCADLEWACRVREPIARSVLSGHRNSHRVRPRPGSRAADTASERMPTVCAPGPPAGIGALHLHLGGAEGIRTPGLLIANETLYQLSYTPTKKSCKRYDATALAARKTARRREAGKVQRSTGGRNPHSRGISFGSPELSGGASNSASTAWDGTLRTR